MSAALHTIARPFSALVLDLATAKDRRNAFVIHNDLTDEEMAEWDRLDDRIYALEAEIGAAVAMRLGVTWAQLEGAMA